MKQMKLFGNGAAIRSDEEMKYINKAEADQAYKKNLKENLSPFLADYGFLPWKTNAYIRLNKEGILEYIDLQKEHYGSKTFTVNLAVMPLYVPNDGYMILDFGNRLGSLVSGKDFWWDYKDAKMAKASFDNVKELLEMKGILWLEEIADPEKYQRILCNCQSEICSLGADRIIWITYYYLFQNDLGGAERYLKKIKRNLVFAKGKQWYENVVENYEKMKELCMGMIDCKAYINVCMEENFSRLKLPRELKMGVTEKKYH